MNTILFIVPLLLLFLNQISRTRTQIQQAIQASNFRTYRTTRNGRIPDRSGATVVIPKPFDIIRQPWSLYNCVRVALSIAQFAFIVHSTLHLVNKHDADDLDKQVEDNYQDIVRMYNTRIVFWVCL